VLIGAALVIASSLGFLIIRQIVQPIQAMATMAEAVSTGDLSQQVQVTSQDELSILADTFNSMTIQLRTLIDNLEQRVAERTAQLKAAQDELLRQERLATLGKLTATVSHEIRNPLATIRTSIFTIDRKTRDKGLGVERALERIERNITRCDDIIGELLDYTRMSEPNLRSVMFDDWLSQFLDEQTLPQDIQLVREFTAEIKVSLDLTRFQRVLINLLDNACQAMLEYVHQGVDQSALILRIQTAVVDGQVQLSISDTGPGIPPDVLPHIFEPLYSTKGFGVGLGLPIVKEIIQQHNGDIEITSEAGQGTRVILRLPVLREERET
jgi:signal transduction histidine kinase